MYTNPTEVFYETDEEKVFTRVQNERSEDA